MSEWQSIETAPKDGTIILAKIAGHPCECRIKWSEGFIDSDERDCGCWVSVDDDCPEDWTDGVCWFVNADENQSSQPTHWKPTNAAEIAA